MPVLQVMELSCFSLQRGTLARFVRYGSISSVLQFHPSLLFIQTLTAHFSGKEYLTYVHRSSSQIIHTFSPVEASKHFELVQQKF
jgi:hypothetical protein